MARAKLPAVDGIAPIPFRDTVKQGLQMMTTRFLQERSAFLVQAATESGIALEAITEWEPDLNALQFVHKEK